MAVEGGRAQKKSSRISAPNLSRIASLRLFRLTLVDVLDVNVGEMRLHLLDLAHPLLLADVVSNVDLLVVEQHVVDGLDGGVGGLGRLVVDETVSPGSTVLVNGDLAGEDVAEGGESVVEGLVIMKKKKKTKKSAARLSQEFPHSSHSARPTLLSISSSKFLMKMLPAELFLKAGSLWLHMILHARPLIKL